MKKVIMPILVVAIVLAIVFFYQQRTENELVQAGCGNVTIANMDWESAELGANIDKFILENAYGCTVELIPGSTEPTFASMNSKGTPDIAPEQWINNLKEPLEKAIAEGRLVSAGTFLAEGGVEGWWIPVYMKEKYPDLESVEDIKKRPDLFPSKENPNKGALFACPSGWGCQVPTINLFAAYGMAEAGFEMVDPGSGAGLAGSIARAYERKEPWFGYYWSPTKVLGKYPMYRLKWSVEHDADSWKNCTSVKDCTDPQVNAWPVSTVRTVITKKFADASPEIVTYLSKRSVNNADLNKVLAWMDSNHAQGEDGALYFFRNFGDIWSSWLPQSHANKVKAAL